MTHHDAFLQDIIAHPEDDAPRLIYADWLDEHGLPARAEFIRLQCRSAALSPTDPEFAELKRRERALLAKHKKQWAGEIVKRVWRMEWSRGFVEDASLNGPAILEHWDRLFELT